MASFRSFSRVVRPCQSLCRQAPVRSFTSGKKAGAGYASLRPLMLGGIAAGAGYGVYHFYNGKESPQLLPVANAAAKIPESQPSVFSQTKKHALYLWIHLKPTADAKACAKSVSGLQKMVDTVTPPSMRDEDDEVWAGVGFGPNFYSQIAGKTKHNYNYPHRKGALGDMPSTGGEIFIHAKSNDMSKLFELCQAVIKNLPAGSVDKFEDTYSFVYKNGRDLSGFIDGTENAADDDDRQQIAVEKETGGSYVITQKWVHNLDYIAKEKEKALEGFVGRSIGDSTELARKPITSHVARMTSGNSFQAKKPVQIVRQSMPFGNIHDKAGLFFIGYAESPENHEYMLDRMVGAGGDGHSDDIMKLSQCVAGTYWYFPGVNELKKLA